MSRTIELPYGRTPLRLAATAGTRVLEAARLPPAIAVARLLADALVTPIGAPSLATQARGVRRAIVIVSDGTRHEPREAMLDAVLAVLRAAGVEHVTLAIATGTHGPIGDPAITRLVGDRRVEAVIDHDGHRDCVELGTTTRGTPIRVHRALIDAELVVATGCIRPHYFAGFAGGAKAVFPGLGEARAIRINHAHKTDPRAIAGRVDDNPCRADLEELVRRIESPIVLVNTVAGPDEPYEPTAIHAAVSGDVIAAHRAGCALARPWFTVASARARDVIASDAWPVTASLYQAAKIAAAAAPVVAPGGRLRIVAACEDGIGPRQVVDEAILRIGVLPRLADGVTLELVSDLDPDELDGLAIHASPREGLQADDSTIVIPRASGLIIEAL